MSLLLPGRYESSFLNFPESIKGPGCFILNQNRELKQLQQFLKERMLLLQETTPVFTEPNRAKFVRFLQKQKKQGKKNR